MSAGRRNEAVGPTNWVTGNSVDDESGGAAIAPSAQRGTAPRTADLVSGLNTDVAGASKQVSLSRSRADIREADLELVRRAQRGDVKAFEDLLERYRCKVFALAMGMLGNREDAMDVLQDTFVRVYRHLRRFQGDSSFYTWVYRIAMNLCIDHARKASRARAVPYEDGVAHCEADQENLGTVPVRHDVNPGKAARREEALERVKEALKELPPHHQQVILLRHFEDLSYEEMAQALQVPKGTIMSRLFHARRKLQKALAEYADGDLSLE